MQNYHKRPNRCKPKPAFQTEVTAVIAVTEFRAAFGVACSVYQFNKLRARDFRLLKPEAAFSEAHAWLEGYRLAQAWTDRNCPDARLFVDSPERAQQRRRVA
jgi:hypothetical protein